MKNRFLKIGVLILREIGMMMMRLLIQPLLWCFILVICLPACQTDQAENNQQTDALRQGVDPRQMNRYYHLKGYLAEQEVSMELLEELSFHGEPGRFFRGFYRYDELGAPIAVYGNLEDGQNLTLTEQGEWDGDPHIFQGKWSKDGSFRGKWFYGNNRDYYEFQFEPAYDAIPLNGWFVQDSLKAFPHWKHGPQLSFMLEWLEVPDGELSESQRSFLRAQITAGLLAQDKPGNPQDLLASLTAQRDEYYGDFQQEMIALHEGGLLDSLADPDMFLSFNYAYNTAVQVYYNSRELLTLGYTDYSYTGGAHGMYATRVKSYDMSTERVLQLGDVMLPGYVESISEALAEAVRTKFALGNKSLDAILFEKDIQPNENFGFTDKGVFFVYSPYEIAPYAAGEIELFVAFDDIKEFVKPEWLPEEEQEEEEEEE